MSMFEDKPFRSLHKFSLGLLGEFRSTQTCIFISSWSFHARYICWLRKSAPDKAFVTQYEALSFPFNKLTFVLVNRLNVSVSSLGL